MKIICTSKNGDSITIQYAFPFYYVSCEGLMSYSADIATSELYIPGEVYQGSHNPKRNLTITFAMRHREYWNLRNKVYSVFGNAGIFTWYPDEGEPRSISYYVETIGFSDPNSQGFRQCNISLLCPFPFFEGVKQIVRMSYWKPLFRLPGVMHSPFQIGKRITEQIVNIYNPQPIKVGVIAIFAAVKGSVTNPGLQNMTSGENFKLEAYLGDGQKASVCTINGRKGAGYLDDPQPFDIWNYETNDWIQLNPGDNLLRYSADSGLEYLDATVEYSQLYLGG